MRFAEDGHPVAFAGRNVGLLAVPAITMLISALLFVVPKIDPRQNLSRSRREYLSIWLTLIIVLAAVHAAVVLYALGHRAAMNVLIPVAVGFLLVVMGFSLRTIRSNFFLGIRTPCTLSSERSWRETHRVGGLLYMALGTILVLSSPLGAGAPVLIVGVTAVTLFLVTYSYLLWRDDPMKASR